MAATSRSVPRRASICEPIGTCRAWVSGMNAAPLAMLASGWSTASSDSPCGGLMKTSPETGMTLAVLASVGAPGAGADWVRNVSSGPVVVPEELIATSRTWYSALGSSPDTWPETACAVKSPPTAAEGVRWS